MVANLLLLVAIGAILSCPFANAFGIQTTVSKRNHYLSRRISTSLDLSSPSATLASKRKHDLLSRGNITSLNSSPSSSVMMTQTTRDSANVGGIERFGTASYVDLVRWFLSTDERSYISSKIDFRPSTRGGLATGGYGAFVNENVNEGELLLRVPRTCCITLDDALNDVECGDRFRKLLETAGPGADTVVIAGYLAKEYLLLKEYDRRLQAGDSDDENNAEMRRLSNIKFSPYLRTLPWERGINAQEHVLFWEDGDVDALLKGSLAYADAVEIRANVKLATGILDGIIGPVIRKARGECVVMKEKEEGFRFPWQTSSKEEEMATEDKAKVLDGLEEAVRGSFVISLSRAFVAPCPIDGGKDEDRLEPVLDMLQHSNTPNIRHRFVEDGSIEVLAGPNLKSGDELFNQYKTEEDVDSMAYHKFFTRFGFVPGVVEPVTILIAERSTIFFPQRGSV